MSVGFLAPQFLWGLLALPLIVLLHYLRGRGKRRTVSALFLWREAHELARRQRFHPTWLLIVQLLFAALAALALARPVISLAGPPDRAIIIDASAGMLAVDSDGERLEKALRIADDLLQEAASVVLLRAGLEPTVIQPLTADRGELRTALASLQAGDALAETDRAIDLAQSVAPEAQLHVIGNDAPDDSRVHFHSVAGDGINYGISTLDLGLGEAFVAVSSNDPRPAGVTVQLLNDGREVARSELLVPAQGRVGISLPLPEEDRGRIEARLLLPEGGDALALDDVAFAGQASTAVALGGSSEPLQRALSALPQVEYRLGGATTRGDLHILFADDPLTVPAQALPPGNVLLFANQAQEPEFVRIRDWAQGDELLRFVDLRDVVVGLPPGEPDATVQGETLARASGLVPVITREQTPEGTIVRVGFHPEQSDLVALPAFPTFIANVVRELSGEGRLRLGEPVPAGTLHEGESVSFALEPGVYALPDGRTLTASLLSRSQTQLPRVPAGEAPPRPTLDVAEAAGTLELGSTLWQLLLVVALLLVLAEWYGWRRMA